LGHRIVQTSGVVNQYIQPTLLNGYLLEQSLNTIVITVVAVDRYTLASCCCDGICGTLYCARQRRIPFVSCASSHVNNGSSRAKRKRYAFPCTTAGASDYHDTILQKSHTLFPQL
jgi:hypothetical protein